MRCRIRFAAGGIACAVLITLPPCSAATAADEPVTTVGPATQVDDTVDPASRASVMASYKQLLALTEVPSGWSGDTTSCRAGDTTVAFKQATLDTVNWYRNLVGLTDATFSVEYNRLAQSAALMMSAAGTLSHSPGTDWPCFSEDGRTGAGSSNLALGASGPDAIHLYMDDPGAGNVRVGHRWWVLRPGTQVFGTGDTQNTNALHVTSNPLPGAEPAVAWPKPGHFPADILPSSRRWSFFPPREAGYGEPGYWSLSDASVTVTGPNGVVPVSNTLAESNRIVWEMPAEVELPSADSTYAVTIHGAKDDFDQVKGFRYEIILVPGEPPDTSISSGPGPWVSRGEAVFEFEEASHEAQCRLDNAKWKDCSSPVVYSGLSVGDHLFEVRNGNKWGWDPTPASAQFTVPERAVGQVAVKVRSVRRSSRLRLDVNPDLARGNYAVTIQRRVRGVWKTVRRTQTAGDNETRVLNLPRGVYRVKVPRQLGYAGARSRIVRLTR